MCGKPPSTLDVEHLILDGIVGSGTPQALSALEDSGFCGRISGGHNGGGIVAEETVQVAAATLTGKISV